MNQIYLFPITIEACEEGGFFADCPILQGCHAEGETYTKALENIQDVIKIHLQARKEHQEILPSVSLKKGTPFSTNLGLAVGV